MEHHLDEIAQGTWRSPAQWSAACTWWRGGRCGSFTADGWWVLQNFHAAGSFSFGWATKQRRTPRSASHRRL